MAFGTGVGIFGGSGTFGQDDGGGGGGGGGGAGAEIDVVSTAGFPPSGYILVNGNILSYAGKIETAFLGCVGGHGETVPDGTPVFFVPTNAITGIPPQPNFTFFNVYNPYTGQSIIPGLQALSPGDVILTEFSYVSDASRNDVTNNINNAVDVYVNGSNDASASSIFVPYLGLSSFNTDPNNRWYDENFRRDGQPTMRPHIGNAVTPLFETPLTSLPATITVNDQIFYLGVHYWLVHEIGPLAGSVRARDAIEWNAQLPGDSTQSVPSSDPTVPYNPVGATIYEVSETGNVPIIVDNYSFDANIPTLQASFEQGRQITTDVLAHKAHIRYFKLDLTVIYTSASNFAVVNAAIQATVQAYFDRQYFGSLIRMSDLLELVHDVPGVDNVRWSNDLPTPPNQIRVLESDFFGNPLHGASVDRFIYGSASRIEQQGLYVAGSPVGFSEETQTQDYFTLSWTDPIFPTSFSTITTPPIPFYHVSDETPVTAGDIQGSINSAFAAVAGLPRYYSNGVVVQQDARTTTGVVQPILSFNIEYGALGQPYLPVVTDSITRSNLAWDEDFFLLDNELPSLPGFALPTDTLPGLIIRPRTQNTFSRSSLSSPKKTGGIFGGPGTFGVGGYFGGSGLGPGGGKRFMSGAGKYGGKSEIDVFGT